MRTALATTVLCLVLLAGCASEPPRYQLGVDTWAPSEPPAAADRIDLDALERELEADAALEAAIQQFAAENGVTDPEDISVIRRLLAHPGVQQQIAPEQEPGPLTAIGQAAEDLAAAYRDSPATDWLLPGLKAHMYLFDSYRKGMPLAFDPRPESTPRPPTQQQVLMWPLGHVPSVAPDAQGVWRPTAPQFIPNAYGLGIHQNQFGQPVTVRPDFGGVPGEFLQLRLDAYGPGIHADQYGRPVREYSWPDGRPVR